MKRTVIGIGTSILCPNCKIEILETNVNLVSGMRIEKGTFSSLISNYEPKSGEMFLSPCCKEEVFQRGKLYTKNGWLP